MKILASATVIFSLVSIVYGFFALFSRRIRHRIKKKPKHIENLMYYKTIMNFDEKNYLKEMIKRYDFPKSYKPDELDFDLARSVIAEARVANAKFMYFNLSLAFLMLSVFMAVIMVAFLGGL